MKKRLLSILLVLIMALSVLPTAAFAEDGGENLPACICETACTAEEMNEGCPVCGAEGAQPENCALYTKVPDVDDPAPEDEDDEAFEEDGTPEGGEASALAPQPAEGGAAVQAAHTHCFCGGSVNAGDHTSHQDVTYTACTRANSLRQIFNIEKVNVAYAYLENDITLDDDLRILGDSDQRGKTLYLCLNGHTLNLGQYFIWVGYMDCTLYLCDCSAQKTGTVSGGSKGCVSVDDAGNYNATFNMYGGTLRGGNRTGFGGGVEIVNGTMNMYGGTITENTATSDGGGIYVGTKGALNLYGGTITGNKVNTNEAHHGGGVYVESNLWSGVGKISISGSPVITGNTRTYTPDSATTTENLYLGYGFTNSGDLPVITLGTVASGANIGISAKKTVFSTASDTDYSGYFSSDDTGYHVEYNADKKLELKSGAAHVHTGGTAYCNKKAVCTTCGKEYGNLDPTNHSAPKPNEWQGDDKEHWQVYSCCNAIINKAAHVGGKGHLQGQGSLYDMRRRIRRAGRTQLYRESRRTIPEIRRHLHGKGGLLQIIDQYFVPKTKIECDGYRSYLNLEGVELNTKKYETDDLHWVHKAISNLKAFLQGTYHGRCTKLQAYLDEYCFRFNRRMTGNQIFLRLTRAVATSCSVLS